MTYAQDLSYYKSQVDTLCSSYFFGRGYTKRGHSKTAMYLKYSLKKLGFDAMTQDFPIEVNTFPECSDLYLNDSIKLSDT